MTSARRLAPLLIAALGWVVSCSSVVADEVIRIMAANTTSGNLQSYDPGEGNRIFQGLDPDIVLVQEMNVGTGTAENQPATYRAWVDANFGSSFSYHVETGKNIPNGIVSRYPLLTQGVWEDVEMPDREFVWAKIDIPGDKDLWAVSVHLSSGGGASTRNAQAIALRNLIKANIPAADYLVIGGDFNTDSRGEACVDTFDFTNTPTSGVVVVSGPYPVDRIGAGAKEGTNASRAKPYDWVMPDPDLDARKTPLVIGTQSFTNGLVFDSRVFTPLSAVSPVLSGDSGATNMQHMAVMRAFLIPVATNAAPLIATAAKTSPLETAPDLYQIVRAASTNLSVTATDDAGESLLKYTWSKVSGPAGAVTFSVNGTNAAKNCTATFQAAGDYTLSVTVQDLPGLSVTSPVNVRVVQTAGSLVLNPPTATLAVNASQAFTATLFDQFSQTMAGVVSWSTSGGGTVNAGGGFTATTAGGPYVVTASSGGRADTSSVTVTRASATVSLANLSQTYDGGSKNVTVTTTPSGRAVAVLYNGSSTPPTNAGSYPVTATITDPNYQGSATATLVIEKAAATVALAGLAPTYDGNPKPVTAVTTPVGRAVAFLYDGLSTPPTDSGNYPVTATITDPNYQGAASGTLVIGKAAASLEIAGLAPTYDGNPKPVTAVTTPVGRAVAFLYDGLSTPPTDAGSYPVTATITDPNYQGAASGTLVIGKAAASLEIAGLAPTYDGNPKPVTAVTTPAGRSVVFLYDGSSMPPTDAGSYPVTATITDPNYQGTASATLVIGKAAATLEITDLATTYDGDPKSVTAVTTPAGRSVVFLYDGSSMPPTDAGSYPVTATITDPNYQGTASATLVIGKAAATLEITDLATTYDGDPKSVTAVTTPAGRSVVFLYDGSSMPPTDAGSYPVTATITDPNYQGTASATLVIGRAPATLEITGLATTYDGDPKPVTVTTTPTGKDFAILYDGSPAAPILAGSYAVTATITDPNFQGASSATLVIAPDELALWQNTWFTELEQTEGLSADPSDPDADGLSNLAEYALGVNPRQFTPPVQGVMEPGGFSLTFTRPANLPGIRYFAEASADFVTWSPVPLEIVTPGAVETVRAFEPFGVNPAVPRFLRLRFERE